MRSPAPATLDSGLERRPHQAQSLQEYDLSCPSAFVAFQFPSGGSVRRGVNPQPTVCRARLGPGNLDTGPQPRKRCFDPLYPIIRARYDTASAEVATYRPDTPRVDPSNIRAVWLTCHKRGLVEMHVLSMHGRGEWFRQSRSLAQLLPRADQPSDLFSRNEIAAENEQNANHLRELSETSRLLLA